MRYLHLLLSSALIVIVFGCSLYRSEGRKQFEATVSNSKLSDGIKIISKSTPQKCQTLLDVQDFYKNIEITNKEISIEVSQENLEFWKEKSEFGWVKIFQIIQKNENYLLCENLYTSDEEWLNYKDDLLTEALLVEFPQYINE